MKLFKKTIAILMLVLPIAVLADTPIVQALKVEQKIRDIVEALHDCGVADVTFESAPAKIRELTRIGDLFDGKYDGPIVLNNTTMPYLYHAFRQVPGRFDMYAPNLTSIPDNAFVYSIGIDTFYGPEVTSIGYSAFDMGNDSTHYSPGIRNALFPKCTFVGESAFDQCRSLTNAVLNTTAINQNYAFNLCNNLQTLDTPPLTSIGYYSLNHCEKLKHLNLSPTSVSFGEAACRNCYSLEITNWPASVSVGIWAFSGCHSITNINELLSRWTTLGTYGMFYDCTSLTELQSDNIASINNYQIFQYCSSVTNISFPNLTAISTTFRASSTFANMASLTHVDMPKLVSVQSGSFDPCQYLFAYDTALEDIELPALISIGNAPNDWYRQAPYMFEGCTKLKRISLPSCKMLFSRAGFKNCVQLKYIEMPALEQFGRDTEGYENYDYGTFVYCRSLENVSFPSLKTLNQVRWTFKQCDSLKNFSAPNLTNIYAGGTTKTLDQMFPQCPALKDVTLGLKASELLAYPGMSSCTPYNSNVIFHCPADAPFNVDVMYVDGTWKAVTNGTFKLAEWIKGTGTQYINTGYVHGTNTEVEIDFALVPRESTTRVWEAAFGSRNNNDSSRSYQLFTRCNSVNKFAYVRNELQYSPELDESVEIRYRAACCTNSCSIFNENGELLYTLNTTAMPDTGIGPMLLFCRNNATTAGGISAATSLIVENMKLYRFTIKEEGETVMDLVPGIAGIDTAEVPCMLDLKNNFHPLFNIGTGSFEAGSVTNSIPTAVGN